MKMENYWTELAPVSSDASVYSVFDRFATDRDIPFLPVVDRTCVPIGIVREVDLKQYAYSSFGRYLVNRRSLHSFLRRSSVLSMNLNRDELLAAIATNPNPDGVVITRGGKYHAVIFTVAVLRLFEEQRVETQARLVQSQKLEAIGRLAGEIAHDVSNILTPIVGYAELMLKLLESNEPVDKDIARQIVVSGRRASETVKRMLSFIRQESAEIKIVSLGDMIREVVELIKNSVPATIRIETRLTCAHDEVCANPGELHQLIINLCINAYHAMRHRGGQLLITLNKHEGDLLGWSSYTGPITSQLLRLSVTDTGSGISPDILPRIFEPFFTTKSQGEGTGMGLSIVQGVVARCKGFISVETEIDQGASFHIYLPQHQTLDFSQLAASICRCVLN